MSIKDLIYLHEDSREAYFGVIGDKVNTMELLAGIAEADISMLIEPLPDDQQAQILEQRILKLLTEGQLTMRDTLLIDRLRNSGNYKYIEYYLAKREAENKKFELEAGKQNLELDKQRQLEVEAQKAQIEAQRLIQESKLEQETYSRKIDEDIRFEKEKHRMEMERLEMEAKLQKAQPKISVTQ